jgi:hypothetical protein
MNLRAVIGIFALSWVLGWSWPASSFGHQDPCHRLHSCPSDHNTYVCNTYVCGDKGRCDQCPDNEFCLGQKPRAATQSLTQPTPPSGARSQLVEGKRVIDGDTLELRRGVQAIGARSAGGKAGSVAGAMTP